MANRQQETERKLIIKYVYTINHKIDCDRCERPCYKFLQIKSDKLLRKTKPVIICKKCLTDWVTDMRLTRKHPPQKFSDYKREYKKDW